MVCYGCFALGTTVIADVSLLLGMIVTTLAIVLHSSLSHEMIHGHPFRAAIANAALVFPALGLFIPYLRFKDTHLAHHTDSLLTDPYDDPESNYMDAGDWGRLPRWRQVVLRANNTLAGRVTLGPLIGQLAFMRGDWRAMRAGSRRIALGWALHAAGLVPLVIWIAYAQMPPLAYVGCAYAALSTLKIRTFLEHQAHERARGRTVVIEDRGPLALLFLNNNLHVVHHMHPRTPWYRLPRLYFANPARYLSRNEGYRYRSYGEVFRRYFLKAKDPVPHPLWQRQGPPAP
ncbi:fatty acid desaturase [Oceanicola sp. D3]|nr:fatty acid desaturase [Oceanicola sp. D3]